MLPIVYFSRMAYQPINLILKCITHFFFFFLSLGKEMYFWIKWITMHIVLLLLSGTRIEVHMGTTIIRTLLQATTFWPGFYWSLLGPASNGQSISAMLYHGLWVPSSLKSKSKQVKVQHDLPHVLDCLGIYSPSVQVPRSSRQLAEGRE